MRGKSGEFLMGFVLIGVMKHRSGEFLMRFVLHLRDERQNKRFYTEICPL